MDRGEKFIKVAGVILALGSVAFAARMITNPGYRPQFAGIEHLSIFSKPSSYKASRMNAALGRNIVEVDPTPVGSTTPGVKVAPGFSLLSATAQAALVLNPKGEIKRVTPGASLDDLGSAQRIEQRGGRWVLTTEKGFIVE